MASPLNILLTPLSTIYSAITQARLALYQAGALTIHAADVPVISVGNLTTGGTGKTPLVAWLARRTHEMEKRVCVLTRGYGRSNTSQQVVVSDGIRLLAEARAGGDEPRLLAEMLQGVAAVVSNSNRVAAARWARENLDSSVFILDDGFQHLALARDLDLVTIDASNPWGGGWTLPRGRLREPIKGLKRADAIIITRSNQVSDLHSLYAETEELSGGRPILLSHARTVRLRRVAEDAASEDSLTTQSVQQPTAAFCAIGNPEAFIQHARGDGHTVAYTKSFPDHHVYTQSDLDQLTAAAQAHGAESLLTTAKDAVKLGSIQFEMPCYVVEIEIEFEDEKKLVELIEQVLKKPP